MPTGGERLRIVVLGYIVRGPIGGMVWSDLHYLMGLARLGHDVLFIEDSDDYESCYDPSTDTMGTDPAFGLRFATSVLSRIGFADRWAYYDAWTGSWAGPLSHSARDLCASADIVLNLAGVNPLRAWTESIPVRVLVDQDPAFTQVRNLTEPKMMARSTAHTHFATFGANLADPSCTIPDDGLAWHPTRQPVVVDVVDQGPPRDEAPFTTVMQWESYEARHYGELRLGMKSESFRSIASVPSRCDELFEIVLGGGTPDVRAEIEAQGWRVQLPWDVSRDPWTYMDYLRSSKAEFGIAKGGYVTTQSGWFSERSTAYLATGRPVIVQETGFSNWLPTGSGVHSFSNLDEAVAAVERVSADYPAQCNQARTFVHEHFGHEAVLGELLSWATS